MQLTFLGSGTSYGVPYVGCDCAVCTSTDLHNKRLRSSVVVETATTRVLVDTTPDLRQQLLRAHIASLDGILWTHSHNDHIIGLDDVRPLSDRAGYIDGYGNADTMAHLQKIFPYAFQEGRAYGGFPRVTAHVAQPRVAFEIGDIRITPVPIVHGQIEIFAYRFESAGRTLVYATDCSAIPPESHELMRGVNVLVLDALRFKEHVSHFSVGQAVGAVDLLKPGRALFTHIAHDLDHETTNGLLRDGISLAHDMLKVEV